MVDLIVQNIKEGFAEIYINNNKDIYGRAYFSYIHPKSAAGNSLGARVLLKDIYLNKSVIDMNKINTENLKFDIEQAMRHKLQEF